MTRPEIQPVIQPMIRAAILLLGLVLAGAASAAPRLVHDATVVWREQHAEFGGFSALEVFDRGTRFLAITDRGHWAFGRLERGPDGRLLAARMTALGPIRTIAGAPVTGRDADAEGMAIDSRGRIYISFEHHHRIRRYPRIDGPAEAVAGHPAFPALPPNEGIEALAIDAEDVLYAIPERPRGSQFVVFRKRDGQWDTALSLRRDGRFLVTGADFGPDGRLYVLERDFAWLGGFRTRVRRFELGPEGFDAGKTLLETGWSELDNMEGISVWQDARGRTRVTLLSDDNFFPLQRTIFAEYILHD